MATVDEQDVVRESSFVIHPPPQEATGFAHGAPQGTRITIHASRITTMKGSVRRRSFTRAGRLVPAGAKHLRGRSVVLRAGQAIEWHSTGPREEILIAVSGTMHLERCDGHNRLKTTRLMAGQCAFLPMKTRHRVVNRSTRMAHYLYLTA